MKEWKAMCCVVLLLSTGSCVAWAKTPPSCKADSQPFTAQFMGMHTLSPTRHWPTVTVGSMRPAGTTWGTIEPKQGQFDWHGLDAWVAASQAHGAQLDYVFLNTPQWASTQPKQRCNRGPIGCAAPPRDDAWSGFITALVQRYKGRIASYEMWNEPNAIGFFTGSAADMEHMVSIAYPIIKSIDPGAIVVSPAPSSTGWPIPYDQWMDQFLAAGGGKYVDAVAWHAYAGRANQPALPPEEIVEQIDKIRAVMAKHGVSDLPLWDTEGGWGGDSQLPDQQVQAAFLARWYLIQFTHGVARAYWYQWNNPNWGTLWSEGTGNTPAALAYARVYAWLSGATGSSPCAPAEGSVWTCTLCKGSDSYVVAWSSAEDAPFIPGSFSTYTGLDGQKRPDKGQAVMLSGSPILFQK